MSTVPKPAAFHGGDVRVSRRTLGLGAAAVLAPAALVASQRAANAAVAEPGVLELTQTAAEQVVPGLQHTTYRVVTTTGTSMAHLLTVDLRVVHTDLLAAPKVAASQRLDVMAEQAGALAAVNADFFQNTVDAAHQGVPATSAPVGVEIVNGKILKSAVPEAQRHGETMPDPVNRGNEVIGVLRNGRAVVTRVELEAFIAGGPLGGKVAIDGLNIYGMGVNQISAFDAHWGAMSRQRIACGTDTRRTAPCTSDVVEVILTDHVVTSVSSTIGAGQLAENQIALVGREAGAKTLAKLSVGDGLGYNFKGRGEAGKLDWAVAGGIVVENGALVDIIDRPLNPRTYAGVSADARTMYLLAVDGRDGRSAGVSTRDGAEVIRRLGARAALLLDGGGSSTMISRPSTEADFELLNRSRVQGIEVLRYIPNGIGVFAGHR